ncbi:BRO family protein [Rahnella sp. ChDrAdgB13]|uniref:BRO-N domain-containing protein n=1 Tax=Rahnella sp. ChDrAdgB13 TaxID=1850581 RepID=UPI001AD89305|nr:BRO family protein [Rahnella sp. ChDrAdgB13]
MQRKNSEAPTTCDSQGFGVSNLSRATNMKSIANNQLQFHNTKFNYMEMSGQIWLTASEVGQALEYSDDKAVQRIYSRHSDEFTENMSGVVKMTTPKGMQESRVFSLRGAHLVAMFARTPKAKEFRRWVLDILDREVATGNCYQAFDFEMYARNAGVAKRHMDVIYRQWNEKLSPSLRALGSPLAAELVDRIKSVGAITYSLNLALERASKSGRIH